MANPGHLVVDDESLNTTYKAISVKETPSPSLRNEKKNNESPTEKLAKMGAKFHKVRAVTSNRDVIKDDVKKKIEKVLQNNLKSGSYVLE